MGVISATGCTVPDMWQSLIAGRSGVDYISSFDTTPFATKFAAEVKGFDPGDYVTQKEAHRMDRFAQFAVAASMQATAAADLKIASNGAEETGVIVGNSVCGLLSVCEQLELLNREGPRRISPILAPTMTGDAAAVQVALLLGAKGPSYSPSSACSSGADAIGQAYELVRHGEAEVMIAGGTEAPIGPICLAAFSAARALSTRNTSPQTACRPFDAQRDGFVLGEGAGIIVLESLDHALSRGVPILAELAGYSATSDAFHLTQPSPDGEGATRALRIAMERAGLKPSDIDYINAHGTSTLLNDRAETRAIKNVFGPDAYRIPISATKSMTGHLLGAAGVVEAIICVLAINHGVVPPTINLDSPDPECDLDFVPHQARAVPVETAVSNSFGFGGHNSVLVFRRYCS
ncbi:MAG: beta-ketoacyl-[acyl-carrier-protein] synthase II [Chloroflexi bacterium RBG_13_53_26]|nr:MAG: beta-ketoacyl-[acyl-carrier-protein] synthase II [Chloroflexi bacterium RBG_13_53_26]